MTPLVRRLCGLAVLPTLPASGLAADEGLSRAQVAKSRQGRSCSAGAAGSPAAEGFYRPFQGVKGDNP